MGTVVAGRWQFGVLGPLEASCGSGPVRLRGERQRALLAVLLVRANELATVEHLVEQLFGEKRSDSAVNAVQVAVSRLRRVLKGDGEEEVLQSRPGGYVLRAEAGQLDAAVFERLLGEGRDLLAASCWAPFNLGMKRASRAVHGGDEPVAPQDGVGVVLVGVQHE